MIKNTRITLILTLLFLITASGCSTYAAVPTTAIAITENTSAIEMTKEPTETAAATSETASETTGETAAVTTAATTAALPAVTVLSAPATYSTSFDTVRIYTDASRTTIQSVLAKGGQVTITGTADKYGVTVEGFYVNLNLMTLIITATPTPAETTAATTKETTKPTPKPTKETTAETEAPVETAAPPVETAAPVATTAAPATDYTAMCAEIKADLIAILEANGQWDPNYAGDAKGWGQAWWGCGYFEENGMSPQDVAQYYYDGKFAGTTKIATSIDCYVADGNVYLDYKGYFPA